jgi:hypothetical protein
MRPAFSSYKARQGHLKKLQLIPGLANTDAKTSAMLAN